MDEELSRRLTDLAGQAEPLHFDAAELRTRVRRRRARAAGALALCAGLTAGAITVGAFLTEGKGSQAAGATSASPHSSHPSKFCGPPRPSVSQPVDPNNTPQLNAQGPLDAAAAKIDEFSGYGKAVSRGSAKPGRFAAVYTGVAIELGWNEVIVWRVPDATFDAAVCRSVPGVTIEFRDAARSYQAADRLLKRITTEFPMGRHGEFTVNTTSVESDGHITIGVDKPEVAKKVLNSYGPDITVTKSDGGTSFNDRATPSHT